MRLQGKDKVFRTKSHKETKHVNKSILMLGIDDKIYTNTSSKNPPHI